MTKGQKSKRSKVLQSKDKRSNVPRSNNQESKRLGFELLTSERLDHFQVKVEWTQQLVAAQKQRTERIRKETENMKAILDAERGRQVEAIKTTQHIEQEEGRANITRIKNEVFSSELSLNDPGSRDLTSLRI